MSLTRQRLLIALVPLFLALPFINRAYFVDDSYFVEIATWLKDHPTEPYHFRADDAGLQNRGWEEDGFVRMVNPLAHHYYLALLMKMGGSAEWFLRLGCVLLSCLSALFIFEFARRWTNTPWLATFLVLVTPVQWLSSYSLLIDPTMVFFTFGALYCFVRATETDSLTLVLVSGALMALAILSKYPGLFILPLTGAWLYLRWKKLTRRWMYPLAWLIALGGLIAYGWWTASLYGSPHILAASARMVRVFGWPKLLVFAVFFSGATLIPLLVWGIVEKRLRWIAAAMAAVLAAVFASRIGGFTPGQAGLLGLWFVTSLLFMLGFSAARQNWIFPRDHFLLIWLFGFVGMMLLVMDWVAARYYCLVVPAVVFAVVRLAEMKWGDAARVPLARMAAVLFVFTGLLAYADYRQANPARVVGAQLKERGFLGNERSFYLGDSFTMSYLRNDGWVPCFPETEFHVGDRILAKEVTMPLAWFAHRPIVIRELAVFDFPSSIPLKVMDYTGSAGFYASVWGSLPFTFSTGPWERFRLFEVVALKQHDAA